MKKIIVLTSIGTGLEYYDFVIYALLASFIEKLFFPHSDHFTGLMAVFGIFAFGYLARPMGGLLLGYYGDKLGRKKVFAATILVMAFATFAMGVMPAYSVVGKASAIIFLILRILQGVSYGAELPISVTFLAEHAENKRRGVDCSLMVASMGIGSAFGSFVVYLLNFLLSEQSMLSWGWRIPFLLGGILAAISYFIRKQTKETPLFIQAQTGKNILLTLFRSHFKSIILGIGILALPACLIVFALSFPTYLHDAFGYSANNIYLVIGLGSIWAALLIPFFGWLSDYVGRKRILAVASLLFAGSGFFLFKLLYYKTFIALLTFMLAYEIFIAAMAGCYFAMLAENFPTSIRCTGVAVCYNFTYIFVPLFLVFANYILKAYHGATYVTFVLIMISFLTFISALLIKNNTGKNLGNINSMKETC